MYKYAEQTVAQMEKILGSSAKAGLSDRDARFIRSKEGKNLVFPIAKTSFLSFLPLIFKQASSYVTVPILVAAFWFLSWQTAVTATVAYVFFIACLYFLYRRRQKQLRSLYRLSSASVCVVRDGQRRFVSPEELVVGDLMLLKAGDVLYADAYIITESELDVFCTREDAREARLKHGGPCFEKYADEPYNLLCAGDVIRLGEGSAFVTRISSSAPQADKELSATEKKQNKLCRTGVYLSFAVLLLSLSVAYFMTKDIEDFMRVLLCAAVIFGVSPGAWSRLLYECVFLSANRKMRAKTHAAFTSMKAVEAAAEGDCFLLSTKSVFQGSRFVVRAFESGAGIRIQERSKKTTPELSLISSAILEIHKNNPSTSYEKYLLSFCRAHASDALGLRLSGAVLPSKNADASVAAFSSSKDGRAFSFVAGDPEELLPFTLYISENGRVRLLDKQTKSALLSYVQKIKRDGHRVVAYAETQMRGADGKEPALSRDLKLLGLFVLSELPDRRMVDTIRWMAENGKKAFFFHDGEDPTWITDALPILRSAPVIDGYEVNFHDEITAFSSDKNMPFAIGIHFTPQQKSKLAHMLGEAGYVTVSYGSAYEDHRLMCATAVSIATLDEKDSVGIVKESADLYAKEHIGAQVGAVRSASQILASFHVSTAYFCASLLARSVLLLLCAVFGKMFLDVAALSLFSLFDLFALACLSHVKSKPEEQQIPGQLSRKSRGLFVGVLVATLVVGALALWMAASPSSFHFSCTAFCFVALLTVLNVGVLRFASVRYSPSVILFPIASLAAAALFLFIESVYKDYPFFVPEFPFWVLLPTVALVAVGRALEVGREQKDDTQSDQTNNI